MNVDTPLHLVDCSAKRVQVFRRDWFMDWLVFAPDLYAGDVAYVS